MPSLRSVLAGSRSALWATLILGVGVLNTVYVAYAVARPDVVAAAMANPVALVFMAEAVVLMGLGAWLIGRAGLRRPGPVAFVVLSLVGTLAFAVPAFALLHLRRSRAAD